VLLHLTLELAKDNLCQRDISYYSSSQAQESR
jgi:hypothetical protein